MFLQSIFGGRIEGLIRVVLLQWMQQSDFRADDEGAWR